MEPLERLVNLVALLLTTGRPLTFEEIREAMGAYDQEDRASAKRQFERDKDALRAIGIPVEAVPTDAWEAEVGYRIPTERYSLPEITFTPEEVAALFVAAHAPGKDAEAAQAFAKIAGVAETGVLSGLPEEATAAVEASAPHLRAVAEAVAEGRRLRFAYRSVEGEEGEREVDAWGLVFSRGSWYLVGRDRARDDVRTFRLSRMLGEVADAGPAEPAPEGFRPRDRLRSGPWGLGEPETRARIAFSPKVAPWALAQARGAEVLSTRRDGWTEARVPASRSEAFVSWVLSFGPDAVVRSPAWLRRAVVEALEAVRASL